MPKTIIWASDGSDNAVRALPHATAQLDGEGSMLIAVHVSQEHSTENPDNARAEADDPTLVEEVRSLVSDATESGIRAALRVVNFPGMQPAQCIADIASEVGADIIVVGTRGHSPVGGVFAGSVAQRLLQVAPCPLLAVPPGAAAPEAETDSAGATQPIAAGSATEL
jgi:nucleotide-binding universal stress UspA family protein